MSVPFTLQFIGGTIDFGSTLHIVVSPNGGGADGDVSRRNPPPPPPPPLSCASPQPVTLAGSGRFLVQGTAVTGFGLWEVEFVFPGPPFANLGSLNISSVFWELTGEYVMMIRDTVTGEQCTQATGMSGEYQFEGAALAGWPHSCSLTPPQALPTEDAGQAPGLIGSMILRGHADIFPTFGIGCPPTLAARANSLIGGIGFRSGTLLDYKLTY
jgi:hypothetical protein